MKNIKLRIVSANGVEAMIPVDGSHGGFEDYYSVVSVDGLITEQKIYGIDPVQSFVLGLKLIEDLTRDKRICGDDELAKTAGASWRIEVVNTPVSP